MNSKILDRIRNEGLVPVVVIEDANKAIPAAKALLDGGLGIMEITMRTASALDAIAKVKASYPEILVGAGTVLSIEKAKEALKSGAEFIVTPGLNSDVVGWCVENEIPITPGCITPTEIENAMRYGLNVLKFFPASVYGGSVALKALSGPYQSISFIPTGGIDAGNLAEYADKPYVHAVGGGWLCSKTDINQENYQKITSTVEQAISILLGFDLAHIGINCRDIEEATRVSSLVSKAFGFETKDGNSSIFSGTGFEILKAKGIGDYGHVAIKTNNILRACYYLEKRGYSVDENSRKEKNGKLIAVYLKDQIGSFGFHLLQK